MNPVEQYAWGVWIQTGFEAELNRGSNWLNDNLVDGGCRNGFHPSLAMLLSRRRSSTIRSSTTLLFLVWGRWLGWPWKTRNLSEPVVEYIRESCG